ncbi:hypothetical protein CR513_44503, partial [Mucuna pruriens]
MPRCDDTPRLKGVINTIVGGFVAGSSSLTRKWYLHIDIISMQACQQLPLITFTDQDFVGSDLEQNDPMVITIKVANFTIKKVLIDQGSSANIIYMSTFRCLQIPKIEIRLYHKQLVDFSREHVNILEYIDLLTTFGNSNALCTISIRYLIVAVDTSYNVLID